MTKRDAWHKAFPTPQASAAVSLLSSAWNELAHCYREHFNPGIDEPDLTLVLKGYLRDVAAPKVKLLGNWGAEDVGAKIDYETGKITERYRTDIRYIWNNRKQNLDLVFEFKKLDHTDSSRKNYYGGRGMLRFITGNYSLREPVAVMAGILIGGESQCVPPLMKALQQPDVCGALSMRCTVQGGWLRIPSVIFPAVAVFDTEHTRAPEKAPAHGTIGISHMFLAFGYAAPKTQKRQRRARAMDHLDDE